MAADGERVTGDSALLGTSGETRSASDRSFTSGAALALSLFAALALPAGVSADMGWGSPSPCDPSPGPLGAESCSPADDSSCPQPACDGGYCGSDTGGWGDPHMYTLDGLAYDFQQVGEYILATNGDDVSVQVRTGPWGGSSTVSTFHAVAANVAGDRVGVYLGKHEPLRVNGTPVAIGATGLSLPHGGRVLRTTTGYRVDWPGGESLTVGFGPSYLNLNFRVPYLASDFVGLSGTQDGNATNDLAPRGGAPLGGPISATDLYETFGDSWRIDQSESLFDYEQGEDTSTFTDEAFPSHVVTARTLPTAEFSQAHAACTAAGITEETQLENCVLDVAAFGGDQTVAEAAAALDIPPPVAKVEFGGYFQRFEDADDGRWSPSARYSMPALDALSPTQTLGLFSGGQTATFTLAELPEHGDVSVAFDLNVIGPWDGETFVAAADGLAFDTTSFSNATAQQAFPDQLLEGQYAAQTGALAVGSHDGLSRAVYHQSYTFAHSSSALTLTFVAPYLPPGASFAIDNVAVVTGVVGDPWDPKCTPTGPSLDDGNACTYDYCDPSLGAVHPPRAAGTDCSDGNLCNGQESCNGAGACVGIAPPLSDGNACTADVCDPSLGVTHTPSAAGVSCSNGVFCDGAEVCNGYGTCGPGTPPNPSSLPPDTTCDGVDDDCSGVADEEYVTTSTTCGVGACAATGELRCVGGHEQNTCAPLFPSPSDSLCDGIDADCNGQTDEDYASVCQAGGVTSCVSGAVQVQGCDDGDPCTDDGCSAGACTHSPTVCDDGNDCTADSCDASGGCHSVIQAGLTCSDGNACTTGDACDGAGACQAGTAVDPNDGNPCTDDSCDPALGPQHVAVAGLSCSDGSACTTNDTCTMGGSCVGGAPLACNDGQFCNGVESCNPSSGCVAGTPPALSDGIACTADSCNESTDVIVHAPQDALCANGTVCDGIETCNPSTGCQAGTPPVVDDANACTADSCDPVTGVAHANVAAGTSCGASMFCDGYGACLNSCPDITLAAGQTETIVAGSGCVANNVTISGGTLTVNGALAAGRLTMSSGSLVVGAAGRVSETTGGAHSVTGGTITNNGTFVAPVFDGSNVSGTSTFINYGRLDIGSDNLTVAAGVTLSESGTLGASDSIGTLVVNGTLRHEQRNYAGTAPVTGGLSLTVTGDATVGSTGVIDVSGRGLRGGHQGGNTGTPGETYNADQSGTVLTVGNQVGGSHGGLGGGASAGATYGSMTAPVLLGSGGGAGNNGGAGGGRIDLVVNGLLTVSGTVRADGGAGSNCCSGNAGGSGGSVRLRVGSWAGAGAVSANGNSGDHWGGGGRVAVEYGSKTATGSVLARSGAAGASGTVYLKNTSTGSAELVLDNASNSGVLTVLGAELSGVNVRVVSGLFALSGTSAPTTLTVQGGTTTVQGTLDMSAGGFSMTGGTLTNPPGSTMVLAVFDGTNFSGSGSTTLLNYGRLDVLNDSLTVPSGVTLSESGTLGASDSIGTLVVNGTLRHEQRNYAGTAPVTGGLSLTVTGDATVGSTGVIDVSGRGLRGGHQGGNTGTPGETYNADQSGTVLTVGNQVGGSHGGLGGGASAGATYGSMTAPVLLGSGGGAGNNGGAGGGRIDLVVNGLLTLTGPVRADGGAGSNCCSGNAGGSGGSVRLRVGSWAGAGAVSANGNSGDHWGGGGRVAVEYWSRTHTGSVTAASGGVGAAGSVSLRDLTTTPGSVARALRSGGDSICELQSTGEILCQGSDALVFQAPVGVYKSLAMGPFAACAVHMSGPAECWGETAAHGMQDEPTAALTDIAIGLSAACGVRETDGAVLCWGSNVDGILSGVPAGAFSKVFMAERTACAQRADGTLACWGSDATGAVAAAPTTATTTLDGGDGFFCALTPDASLTCWGDSSYGQTTPPSGTGYQAVSAGRRHACAIDASNAAVCWGDNTFLQCNAPVGAYQAVAAGDEYTCGWDDVLTLSCWGASSF